MEAAGMGALLAPVIWFGVGTAVQGGLIKRDVPLWPVTTGCLVILAACWVAGVLGLYAIGHPVVRYLALAVSTLGLAYISAITQWPGESNQDMSRTK